MRKIVKYLTISAHPSRPYDPHPKIVKSLTNSKIAKSDKRITNKYPKKDKNFFEKSVDKAGKVCYYTITKGKRKEVKTNDKF